MTFGFPAGAHGVTRPTVRTIVMDCGGPPPFFLAPAVRQIVAHGATVGNGIEREPAPDGAKEGFKCRKLFLPPLPGL